VGNAFATSKLVFSHDVQNLTPIQYPFVTFARQHNLRASVALVVRSQATHPERVAVMEFFLPHEKDADDYEQGLRLEEQAKRLVNNLKMGARWFGLQVRP